MAPSALRARVLGTPTRLMAGARATVKKPGAMAGRERNQVFTAVLDGAVGFRFGEVFGIAVEEIGVYVVSQLFHLELSITAAVEKNREAGNCQKRQEGASHAVMINFEKILSSN